MLGEQVGETRGKRTARSVVCVDAGVRIDVSFEASGKILGADVHEIGSYSSRTRPDGTVYGEGQGVIMTADGDMATWKGQGVGRFVGGGVSFRGAIYVSSASARFSRLNSVATVYEHEVDAEGNTHSKLWEWK